MNINGFDTGNKRYNESKPKTTGCNSAVIKLFVNLIAKPFALKIASDIGEAVVESLFSKFSEN